MGTIQEKLGQVRELFLTDVDEDIQADNLNLVNEWDKSIRENSAFAQWQGSDISKMLIRPFRDLYRDASLQLAENRDLTEAQRCSLWAKKDAALIVLDIIARDAESELVYIHKELNRALSST